MSSKVVPMEAEIRDALASKRNAKWYVKWGTQTKLLLWKNWRLAVCIKNYLRLTIISGEEGDLN